MTSRRYDMSSRSRVAELTRDRTLEAAREQFFALPYDEVTIASIARAAGISHQTLLNHFGSKDGLFAALVARVGEEIAAIRGDTLPRDAGAAVRILLRQYEAYGDVNARLGALQDRIPAVAEAFEIGRASHQGWLAEAFEDRLPPRGAERRMFLAAMHAATDVNVWKLLRRDLGLSRAQTGKVMERLLLAVLENH